MLRSVRLWSCALLSSAFLVAPGCAGPPPPAEDVQVMLSLAAVPADVACVRLTAAGPGRTVVREIPVSAGAMINEAFSGLPLGTVVFRGEAFGVDCEAVTKTTIPGWASDPETVAIILGRLTTVSLTLNRNGRAKVNVEFSDEPTCTPAPSACITNAECCSKSCKSGTCQPGDAGASDGG
jgi:hypothetical protein